MAKRIEKVESGLYDDVIDENGNPIDVTIEEIKELLFGKKDNVEDKDEK